MPEIVNEDKPARKYLKRQERSFVVFLTAQKKRGVLLNSKKEVIPDEKAQGSGSLIANALCLQVMQGRHYATLSVSRQTELQKTFVVYTKRCEQSGRKRVVVFAARRPHVARKTITSTHTHTRAFPLESLLEARAGKNAASEVWDLG